MKRLFSSDPTDLITLDRDGDVFILTVGDKEIKGSHAEVYDWVVILGHSTLDRIMTDIYFKEY